MAVLGRTSLVAVVVIGIALQFLPLRFLSTVLSLGLGLGRTPQPLADFPFQCRRIHHPLLQACEDMWLSEPTRDLYLACAGHDGRKGWFPWTNQHNLSGRSENEAFVRVHIDQPGFHTGAQAEASKVAAQKVRVSGYAGTAGDGLLHMNGFAAATLKNGRVRFLVTNSRPALDLRTGTYVVDQASVGSNATIEVFELESGGSGEPVMHHKSTIAHENISTPNRVAAWGDEGFYITNDHGKTKSGEVARMLAMLSGRGDVTFCTYQGDCKIVASGYSYPNGLLLHSDGRLYVPSPAVGEVYVFQPHEHGAVEKLPDVNASYAIDNLSEDANGDLFGAMIPIGLKTLAYIKDTSRPVPPSGVVQIRKIGTKGQEAYAIEKILEDAGGEVLPAATTVVHDVRTGRLFLSGVASNFIAVCDPK